MVNGRNNAKHTYHTQILLGWTSSFSTTSMWSCKILSWGFNSQRQLFLTSSVGIRNLTGLSSFSCNNMVHKVKLLRLSFDLYAPCESILHSMTRINRFDLLSSLCSWRPSSCPSASSYYCLNRAMSFIYRSLAIFRCGSDWASPNFHH